MPLLPWHVNETLTGKEAESVLKHLATCAACQDEVKSLYGLQQLVQESESPGGDSELSLRRSMNRIKASEKNRESLAEVAPSKMRTRFRFPLGVAASALLLVAAIGYLVPTQTGEEFRTLSLESNKQGSVYRLELEFENPIPASTLRQALIETDSHILSGPDEQGHYLVEVIVPYHVSAHEYLLLIKDIEGVEHAQFAAN